MRTEEQMNWVDAGALQEREKIVKRVSMLRQALNEDRITDPNRMIDNEYLKRWLDIE